MELMKFYGQTSRFPVAEETDRRGGVADSGRLRCGASTCAALPMPLFGLVIDEPYRRGGARAAVGVRVVRGKRAAYGVRVLALVQRI